MRLRTMCAALGAVTVLGLGAATPALALPAPVDDGAARPAGPAAAGPATVGTRGAGKTKTYLQLNLAGNSMHHGEVTPAKSVVARVREKQPYVVTLNEVCATQYDYLEEKLADEGYRGQHGKTGVDCDDGSAFGNAVFIRIASTLLGNWKLPNSEAGEHRNLLCVKATNYAMVACSTHISWAPEDKKAQVEAVADRVKTFRDKGYRVIVGGDFNLTPTKHELDPMYHTCYPSGTGQLIESDSPRCGERGGEPTKDTWKLDHLFFSTEYTDVSAEVVETTASDHRELWATATY